MERSMRGLGMPLLHLAPLPAADMYETDKEVVVELEVPGFEEKELEIEMLDHVLTVKGKHEATTDTSEKTFHLHERIEQEFERRFELPSTVDTEKLTATFKTGVLELHAPKAEIAQPKKIPVTT
jgi:HSP20 family protein